MAEQEGVSAIALRIGAFQPLETVQAAPGVPVMDALVSQRDLDQLIIDASTPIHGAASASQRPDFEEAVDTSSGIADGSESGLRAEVE